MISLASPSAVLEASRAGLRPDPLQTLSQWSDAHMVLPPYASERGPFRTARVPFLKEIMDCLSPSHPCQEVVFMKCVQIAGTQCAVNWASFIIDRVPASMMLVEPTVDLAKKLSKTKIQQSLDDVKVLRGKVHEVRSRDAKNTILMKEFTGGMLVFAGANSGVSLRFLPARFLFLDEIDAYPQDVDGEGHPVELAENRTSSFARCKIYKVSTPLTKELSVIEPAYLAGSRGRYHVPCPFCLHMQHLEWKQFIFTIDGVTDPKQAAYRCVACLKLIPEHHKTFMLENGKWVHEDSENPVRSFHINMLYQPYGWKLSWKVIAETWLKASKRSARGDTRALKVFINTYLAQTWEEKAEKFAEDELAARKELYNAQVPAGVLVLTGAVDVQDDRLEVECLGWGLGEECWSIDYQRFMGSPAQNEVWDQLDTWLQSTFEHEYGMTLKMLRVCIDTGGHFTKETYSFVARRQQKGILAVKGSSTPGARLVTVGSKDKLTKVRLFLIGTDTAKDTLFANFKIEAAGPGYCHFPDLPNYDDEYFAQLTAEEKREKIVRGVVMGHYYRKTRKRNEALDLRIYNQAALAVLNPNMERIHASREADLKKLHGEPDTTPAPIHDPLQKPSFVHRPRTQGFVKGWK